MVEDIVTVNRQLVWNGNMHGTFVVDSGNLTRNQEIHASHRGQVTVGKIKRIDSFYDPGKKRMCWQGPEILDIYYTVKERY